MKLSIDDLDLLQNALESDSWPVLLKVIEDLVCTQERTVLVYDLTGGSVEGLAYAKCRSEGARKLMYNISQLKNAYLKKNKA